LKDAMHTKYWLLLLVCCTLSSCMYGSAAVTGAQVVYDRHNLSRKIDNNYTTLKAYRAIYLYREDFQNTHVSISIDDDAVLLTGQTPYLHQKTEIENMIKVLVNNREIYNYVEIASPVSFLTKTSDAWITTKIKTEFIASNQIDPTKIKVITENGTVFLRGIVPKEQAEIAIEVAKSTSGVQKIVPLFSYLVIERDSKTVEII